MNVTYCDLFEFRNNYKDIHGYLSVTVCVFGSIANIFNICVLRAKQMRSPTNYILTGLAVSDLLVMLEYIPFTVHRNLSSHRQYASHISYSWAVFYKFHAQFTIVLHFISCCLTIILAIWRYIYVSKLHGNKISRDLRKTSIVIIMTYLICPLICIPMFYTLEIKSVEQRVDRNGRMVLMNEVEYFQNKSELSYETTYVLYPNDPHRLSLWVYSLLLKLFPCVLLTIWSILIVSVLLKTKKRRQKLLVSSTPLTDIHGKGQNSSIQIYKENQADRTTKMLLVVLFLFLITEFPLAILGQISAILGDPFFTECYANLGDLMDIIVLTNSAINFILYCAMSRKFRETFQEVFKSVCLIRWFPVRQEIPEENGAETKMSLV